MLQTLVSFITVGAENSSLQADSLSKSAPFEPIVRQQHLRSTGCHQLLVPRHRRSMFCRRAFSVAGLELVTRLPSRSDAFC